MLNQTKRSESNRVAAFPHDGCWRRSLDNRPAGSPTEDQRDYEQNQEEEEEDSGELHQRSFKADKAKKTCDQGKNQKAK